MASQEIHTAVEKSVRQLQIIVAALTMGCVSFLAVVLLVLPAGKVDRLLLTWVSLAFAAGSVVVRFLLPAAIAVNARKELAASVSTSPAADATRLAAVFATATIVGAAVMEGPAFLAILAYMQERTIIALCLAIILVAGVVAHFPTIPRTANWVENQLRLLGDERAMRR